MIKTFDLSISQSEILKFKGNGLMMKLVKKSNEIGLLGYKLIEFEIVGSFDVLNKQYRLKAESQEDQ